VKGRATSTRPSPVRPALGKLNRRCDQGLGRADVGNTGDVICHARFSTPASSGLVVMEEIFLKKVNKPTGFTGPVKVTITPGNTELEFQKFQFPIHKEEIEEIVVKGFIRTINKIGDLSVQKYEQNEQNDLDFNLYTNGGLKLLELMEVAPLEHLQGSYDKALDSYKGFDFAEYILKKIMKKSDHYSGVKSNIFLLIYVTDWHFILSETTTALLQYWTLTQKHNFERIYYYKPCDEEGIVSRIFPTPIEFWQGFNPNLYRDNITRNFNPMTEIHKL